MANMHDMKKESQKYLAVGIGLLVLTAITVAAASLNVGLALGILVALLIATIKGSLVASFFMHLASEKKFIYALLLLTLLFLVAMMGLILAGRYDLYEGMQHVS